ncbi:hypothetical protein CHS0354_009388 [Potamilus streckersoni]|uniref:C2 domain-containing protein n=1 Tax=Potamilus streckersoni TaxID=2493646 RepID=A0AAE0T4N8_9BIVA|nr:hypothetical protein CHS0354_009388 [Potamilus streckersoni]
MGDTDLIPVRDTGGQGQGGPANQKRMVSKWSRDELEDKYLRLYEENIILKKHARKQEDKIKRMATKLLRLVNDKKKSSEQDSMTVGGKRARDIETEEKLEELHEKLQDYEKQNEKLREKLMLAKQQLSSTNKRPSPYNRVSSRISTGIPKQVTIDNPRVTKNIRVMGPPEITAKRHSSLSPGQRHGALEETRNEYRRLEEMLHQQQEQMNMYEQEIAHLKEQLRLKDADYEEDLAKIKQQMTAEQRISVQENIDLIKLQREVKEKSTKLLTLQEKYGALEENLRTIKRSHDNVMVEMENLNIQLKEEQNKNLELHNELKLGSANQRKMIELQEQVGYLQKEIAILKEANEKLVSSAFDLEKEREWRQRENALKVQIAQLEATLKADLGEKGGIIDRYAREKEMHEKLQDEFRELQLQHFQVKEQYDDLMEKMKFFTKESAIDFSEIEEALVLIKQKKQKEMKPPDFLHLVDEEKDKEAHRRLIELQAEYAETVHELEKTRNMLVVQHKINKDYQHEVELTTQKMDEIKKEYEMKLDEYARLLDIRAARIKKLEAQMRDVAYGTKQYKIQPPIEEEEGMEEFDETIHLERGQNLFEIHVHKVTLSQEAIKLIGDEEPALFCTWEFFEYEIQSTPVLRGSSPEFGFTSQYIVKVDDFFLHYIQKESCTLELHQSFGQDYSTLAACQLIFREIFDKTHGRIHGTATLSGVAGDLTGVGFGTVEYWIRLRVPMEQALRLYKERTKALGYMASNMRATDQALQALDETAALRPKDNVNELHIKIIRCSGLKSRREHIQPSPYCVYQFFDYNDRDTAIVPNSNNPEFNDHRTFPVPMLEELDTYLKTVPLKIFVFDDTDPEQTAYLGIADIPLIPLAHDKGVTGMFELKGPNGKVNGTIEVELRWQFTYVPPKTFTKGSTQKEAAPMDVPVKLTASEDSTRATNGASRRIAAKFPQPSATSTPMPRQEHPEKDTVRAETSATAVSQPHRGAGVPVKRRLLETEEVQNGTESIVHEAVSRVVSDIMPSGLDSSETPRRSTEDSPKSQPPSVLEAPSGPQINAYSSESEYDEETDSERGSKAAPSSVMGTSQRMEDTMFGDNASRESETESIHEEITPMQSEQSTLNYTNSDQMMKKSETEEEESETPPIESDSEGLVMVRTPTKRKQKEAKKPGNTVTITITSLALDPDSPPMQDDSIKQLFVEYKFLGIKPEETETPFSLPKPRPNSHIQFNFSNTFHVDFEKNYTRRQILASMLLPSHADKGRIRFTVVSEPDEDEEDAECEDIGVVIVSIPEIFKSKKDIIDEDVDIVNMKDEKTVIGSMKLTVQCLAALEAVAKEMQVQGTY